MLKELVGDFFGFNKEIKALENTIVKQEKICSNLSTRLGEWRNDAEKYSAELEALKKEIEETEAPTSVPSAEITFRRPVLISEKNFKQVEIDVRNFIMPDFEMENKLIAKNLIYDGTQDLDELIPSVYHFAKKGYKYGFDKEYGFNEYWMFPFELQTALKHKKAGDCDDWANLIGSYFAAADIPRNRWLISVGETRSGIGHATVYAKDEIGIWRHLNSTKPESTSKELFGFPSSKDKNDSSGIKPDGFWFSYNDVFAIHRWDSEKAKKAFEAAKLPVTIKRSKND